MALSDPVAEYLEDEYIYTFKEEGVRLVFEKMGYNRDGQLRAFVTPHNALGTGQLAADTVNLDSARVVKSYARTLEGKAGLDLDDWFRLLDKAGSLTRTRFKEGEPLTWLRDVELNGHRRYLIHPYVTDRAINLLYGDGGSAKSVLALALAVCVATDAEIAGVRAEDHGPVLYLDWEDDAETHAERLRAICEPIGWAPELVDVAYQRMASSLHDSAREVRKKVAMIGARMVVMDSVGMACGGDPNDAGAIIRALLAARGLGVPVIAIHHLAKDAKRKDSPYGSVYAVNEVRSSWLIEAEQSPREPLSAVLTQHKANRSERNERRGLRIEFTNEDDHLTAIEFEQVDVNDLPSSLNEQSQRWQALEYLVEQGPQPTGAIADHLDTSEARTRNLLRDNPTMFVDLGGRPKTWGAASSRDEDGSQWR